ncbi:hypothetical protein U8335_03850 [Roseiconus lacunae]|uniref:hypothetical protein n=1 Tax=Roseiconus lacunae TaxID=2605694 RepID=UPI0030935A9A|nr:hypothetical protein U8335_03850 [Stieleria sp. HD01]
MLPFVSLLPLETIGPMRTHCHETLRRILEAIDVADGTGRLDVPLPDETVQSHLDLAYTSGLAIAIDDAPYTRLTDAGLELLIYSRDRDRWARHVNRNPFADADQTVHSLLMSLRSQGAGRQAG